MFFRSTKAKKINILTYFQATSKKCLGTISCIFSVSKLARMHMKKGSPISVSVTSNKCAVKGSKKEFHIVFPDLLFHLLEELVLVGLDKIDVGAGVIDNRLISFTGHASMFDHPCLPSPPSLFFSSTHLCFLVIVNTVPDQ